MEQKDKNPKPRGRKKLGDGEKKKHIPVYATDSERAEIERLAKEAGQPVSIYIINSALKR